MAYQTSIKQYKENARRQRYYSTLAKKESKYAHKKAIEEKNKGHYISAKDYEREEKVCKSWADKRTNWSKDYERKAQK